MSYEGYVQCWCENGHMFDVDCYSHSDKALCPYCQAKIVVNNNVDQTNCEDYGYIKPRLKKLGPTCPCCNSRTGPDVFEIPPYKKSKKRKKRKKND